MAMSLEEAAWTVEISVQRSVKIENAKAEALSKFRGQMEPARKKMKALSKAQLFLEKDMNRKQAVFVEAQEEVRLMENVGFYAASRQERVAVYVRLHSLEQASLAAERKALQGRLKVADLVDKANALRAAASLTIGRICKEKLRLPRRHGPSFAASIKGVQLPKKSPRCPSCHQWWFCPFPWPSRMLEAVVLFQPFAILLLMPLEPNLGAVLQISSATQTVLLRAL